MQISSDPIIGTLLLLLFKKIDQAFGSSRDDLESVQPIIFDDYYQPRPQARERERSERQRA